MSTPAYKTGSDVIYKATLLDKDGEDIALSSLDGYGLELTLRGAVIGKWGFNLTGFTDEYYVATGTNEITFYLPDTVVDAVGLYEARIYINYAETEFPDNLRDLYSNNVPAFSIE